MQRCVIVFIGEAAPTVATTMFAAGFVFAVLVYMTSRYINHGRRCSVRDAFVFEGNRKATLVVGFGVEFLEYYRTYDPGEGMPLAGS